MRTLSFFLAAGALLCSASAQTTADYLSLRQQQHILLPTPGQKLDSIVGPSIVEVQGVVQGSFKAGNSTTIMVKRDDNDTLVVQCPGVLPEWLGNGEVAARLLLRLNRATKFDPIQATLLSAAPESDISKIDELYWKGEAAKAEAKKKAAASDPVQSNPRGSQFASRGGGDMYGWIGRSHRAAQVYVSPDGVTAAYSKFIRARNPRLKSSEVNKIAESVIGYSLHYNVDARLVIAVIIAESDFNPKSTSSAGAIGIGQLMLDTAKWMGVSNPYDIQQNLYGMIKLLRTHMDQFGLDHYQVGTEAYFQKLGVVLAAYNAGEGAVRRAGGIPHYRETEHYIVKVINIYRRLASI